MLSEKYLWCEKNLTASLEYHDKIIFKVRAIHNDLWENSKNIFALAGNKSLLRIKYYPLK